MKHFKIFFLFFLCFTVSTCGNSIKIRGSILDLSFCYDVNSPRFKTEYGSYGKDYNLSNPNIHAMEITTKIDDGIFEKYCIIIEELKITTLKSNLSGEAALRSLPTTNHTLNHLKNVIEDLPKINDDINLEIAYLKKVISAKGEGEPWLTYSVIEYKSFDNTIYLAIQFDGSYTSFGGILYVLTLQGEIIKKIMLGEDISKPILYYCKILSEDKMVLLYATGHSGFDTIISVVPILK